MPDDGLPRLYHEFARWFHLLTAPEDYREEASVYAGYFVSASKGTPRTLLELGSGGGNNASHLKAQFDCTLVDLSEDMLALSRELNPELEHQQGDMRTVRLGRTFDCVFIHDAVSYITTAEDLRATMATAFVHTRPGGVTLIAPDCTRETFDPRTEHGGHDGADGRGLRYLSWDWDPEPEDSWYYTEFAYLMREDGEVRAAQDRHTCGVFSRNEWLHWLAEAGFSARHEEYTLVEDEDGPGTYELFLAVRPE